MKAAVCREFGRDLSIEDIQLATPNKNEVSIKIQACAICHSDITFAEGGWGGDLPAVFGHEASGIVTEIGEGVDHVSVGDHVIVTLIRYCGTCYQCQRNHHVVCEHQFSLDQTSPLTNSDGEIFTHGLRTGAFAEYVTVESSQVVAMPKDIDFAPASLLACGVITGLGAVWNTADIPPQSSVVVIGAGGVGLNAIQGAKLRNASHIIVLDPNKEKRELTHDFGATHTLDAFDPDVRKHILHHTNGRGADYVFVTVGAKQAIEQAPRFIAPAGQVVLVGIPENGIFTSYSPVAMASYGQRILGSKMGDALIKRDIPKLIELYKSGDLKLDQLISNTYSLHQINEAIAEVKTGRVLRNVIVFDR